MIRLRRALSSLVMVVGVATAAAQPASTGAGSAAGKAPAGKAQPPAPLPPSAAAANAPALVSVTAVSSVTAPTGGGFLDDGIVLDGDRLAYVVADSTAKAELHVVDVSTKAETVLDISKLTLQPVALKFVGKSRVFVIGKDADGRFSGGAVELAAVSKAKPAGSIAYKIAPATHLTVITRDGKARIAAVRESAAGDAMRYEAEILALDSGKRVGATHSLELTGDANTKLGFRVNHWSDGWTKATGIRAGEWDKKEDQQSPEAEATFDLVTGKLGPRVKINDLFEQRKRFTALAEAAGQIDHVRWSSDKTKALQLWANGQLREITLDQPVASYDKSSLQGIVAADGSAWIALKVDPVNADAVARQKADAEYLDVFKLGPAPDGAAIRRARILARGVRHRLGAPITNTVGDTFYLLERNQGFERGGKTLTVYRPQ